MDVTKSGDRVLIELSLDEAIDLASRMCEVLGVSQDEMDLIFEEVLS